MARKSAVAGKPGTDSTLPNVPLTINGKTYHLAFDFGAICMAESLTGLNLLASIELSNLNATQYRALLYSALLKENADITMDEVNSLINIRTLAPITLALVQAWTGSQPEIVKEEGANPPVEQPALV